MIRKLSTQLNSHAHFAGRYPVGVSQPVTVSKRGIIHRWRRTEDGEENDMYVVGAACSEILSSKNLANVLRKGHEMEAQAIEELERGDMARCLSIHTSAGTPSSLTSFLDTLSEHVPSNVDSEDWFASIQLEGASAVWAAVDLLWQLQHVRGETHRNKVAVGEFSYHGPSTSSYGGKIAEVGKRDNQIVYPVPAIFSHRDMLNQNQIENDFKVKFQDWLNLHGNDVACMLVEPQWGSSVAAQPWSPELLRHVILEAQSRGILVCADEIMCGLFRHGKGTMFLSDAWDLNVDAVTFGKSVAAGMFPLSGTVLSRGASELRNAGKSVIQSHTYAGSSVRALMTAETVLRELPKWTSHINQLESVLCEGMNEFQNNSNGLFISRGHGMMWGSIMDSDVDMKIRQRAMSVLKSRCKSRGVWPYFIPVGGIMVTPLLDASEIDLRDAMSRLSECSHDVAVEMGI